MFDEAPHGVALKETSESPDRGGTCSDALSLDPQLAKTIYELLNRVDLGDDVLHAELERLEGQYTDEVYAELIFTLSHLRFPGEIARRHWFDVIEHQRRMAAKLESNVDLRVALASYFLEINRSLQNPMLIEMRVFEQTRASAYWDELTGLRNYRFFSEHLGQELLKSQSTGDPLSLVMIDVDDFKPFNDTYGHEAGNDALAHVAKLVSSALRPGDVVSRYGGEEFGLVLASTPKQEAQQVAERVRKTVADHQPLRDRRRLTVSLGVATYPADAYAAGELVRNADRALYAAKFGGKDMVRLFGESTRSYVRVNAALRGSFTTQSPEWSPMRTVRISQGGLQFKSPRNLLEKSVLEFQIELPSHQLPVTAVGRVVRVDGDATAGFRVAVQFVEVAHADRARLNAHLEAQHPPQAGNATHRAV